MAAICRNILIFHQGALGDFIVTWPLALGVARVFAQSRVFYVTAGQKGALAEKALRVESADVENGWHQLYSVDPKLPEPASKLLAGAQQIISFVSGAEDVWAKNVRRLAPDTPLLMLSTIPPETFGGHVTEYLLGELQDQPIIRAAMAQMLQSIAARGLGLGRSGGAVLLHPGAGSGKKCWPPERFLELTNLLKDAGLNVAVILGEVELERWPAAQINQFAEAAELRRPDTLIDLMDAIAGASVFVGNDSGPGHLAGIMGVPTISIFGPKDPARWKPLGPRVAVVQGEWDDLRAPVVFGAIERARGA